MLLKIKKSLLFTFIIPSLFLFACSNSGSISVKNQTTDEKPVIYLYGYDNEEVSVKLDYSGTLTCTYPQYNIGWKITAAPDGTLTCNGKEYNYLYWEGSSDIEYSFEKGFCIAGNETAAFLEKKLSELRLNSREINEFIIYWLPRMQNNPYNVISFQTKNYTENAKLTVEPKPDKTIRIFMAWYPVENKIEIPEQKFSIPKREGKVLVEWGGAEVDPLTFKQKQNSSISTNNEIVKALTGKSPAEIDIILKATVAANQAAQLAQNKTSQADLPSETNSPLMPTGKTFTDKNGNTSIYTQDEWNYLISVWAYTGQAEEMISHHTNAELRAVINNR